MQVDWTPLTTELRQWRAAGLDLPLWWRDDDALANTAVLERLERLAQKLELPVHLAVIPKHAKAELSEPCSAPWLIPMVHGWAHENHAPDGAKKAEFGHQRPTMDTEAKEGLTRLEALFGNDLCKVFVPPWNRVDPDFATRLPAMGYAALSTYTPRQNRLAAPGLVQINTHLDPIFWRQGGGLVPKDRLIEQLVTLLKDRREGHADRAEPLGYLTHHLVHDEAIWHFSETCLSLLLDHGARPVNLHAVCAALP